MHVHQSRRVKAVEQNLPESTHLKEFVDNSNCLAFAALSTEERAWRAAELRTTYEFT